VAVGGLVCANRRGANAQTTSKIKVLGFPKKMFLIKMR
jgi:hypothetical protein